MPIVRCMRPKNGVRAAPKSLEIVRTIMHLAQKMNITVIAEGIETLSQQQHLQSLDCFQGQGFLFTAAIDGPAAEDLIIANTRLPQWA